MIGITQPRRVAAVNLAERVSWEMHQPKVGQGLVGYRVRFDEKLSHSTKIKFLTDGMLLREAIVDNKLSQYSMLVLDEAHERTVNSDVLMALIKDIVKARSNQGNKLKLVVMSATLDLDKFTKYFESDAVVTVKGRTFPIEVYHTIQPQLDYLTACMKIVLQIILFEE